MVSTTLNHYRIVRSLGSGGMGEVYLADDGRLKRSVAIKILPLGLAAQPERRERFAREGQAVAALNHANIVTVYSVESDGDTHFLTMEYVDGQTLADLLPRGGMPLKRLLHIARQIVDAVIAAHERGIVHRDLKPANVMVGARDRVKVLDFGLAKLREPAEADIATAMPTREPTGEGRIVGTVAYMSPEQAEGKPVDERSDIFSLGVILYEMGTGMRPFAGDTSMAVLSAILRDTPRAVNDLNPSLPSDLARIVRHCLAKPFLFRRRAPTVSRMIGRATGGQSHSSIWPGRAPACGCTLLTRRATAGSQMPLRDLMERSLRRMGGSWCSDGADGYGSPTSLPQRSANCWRSRAKRSLIRA